jgi:hypothetical protein
LAKDRLGDQRPPSLWPSEASAILKNSYDENYLVGTCRRSVYFRYLIANYHFYPDIHDNDALASELIELIAGPDRYMRWIWEAGKLYEDFVVEMAKQSGVYVDSQIQIVIPAYNIVGKLDLIVRNPDTGDLVAEEVKSIYGYNANEILGTPSMRGKQLLGTPRESNMMQLALYNWHLKTRLRNLEASHLFYGARDTGRDAEFEVTTYEEDGVTKIRYEGVYPHTTKPTVSPITIDNILNNYNYVLDHFRNKVIPPRDFELNYSEEKIQNLYEHGELSKTDREQHEKVLGRIAENKVRIQSDQTPKKEIKGVEKGDWQCDRCNFRKYCYQPDGSPRS